MGARETAAAVKDGVGTLGGGFMLSRHARAVAEELGIHPWALYHLGRGSVLGDVEPSVVAAAFGFLPVEAVARGWTKGRAVMTPAEAADRYSRICQDWGRARLAAAEGKPLDDVRGGGLDRLAELLERVVAAGDPAGRPLFAGWAAVPRPDDAPARVTLLCHVLREHRGAGHLMAVLAEGLTPLEAVLTGGGPDAARFFAWPEPYPDVAHLAERRTAAEERTNDLAAQPWGALSDDEQTEVAALLAAATEVATRR